MKNYDTKKKKKKQKPHRMCKVRVIKLVIYNARFMLMSN